MRTGMRAVLASGRQMSGPAQRAVRLEATRGSAARAFLPHPLDYRMGFTI
ncbi:hypothetical protein [Lysobacter sp.]|nr:hypothetical protein [Lysobacter sp.]